jgi:hypothetical protein
MTADPSTGPVALARRVFEWALPPSAATDGLIAPAAVRLTGPAGQTLAIDAFPDGNHWRARAALDEPGDWRWQTTTDSGTVTVAAPPTGERWPAGSLRLSDDRRTLTTATGAPFFWLGDTAWYIVWKGTPEQWVTYLDRRVAQGFSVVHVILLPLRWEWPDVEGNSPFVDDDKARPNPAWFRRYDAFIRLAAERGLTVFLPLIWGGPRAHLPAVRFTTEQAVAFTRYAVARYAAFPMVWSVSGDAEYVQELEKWEAVGDAVEAGDPYGHPTTNHLPPSMNWHALHHRSRWHDFHMLQTGHRRSSIADIAALPAAYYRLAPVKAVLNGEPWYEAHPSRDMREYGPAFTGFDARYAFWVSVLSGATMGHSYGGQGIWNWKRPGDDEGDLAGPQIGPPWFAGLEHPGATFCGIGAACLRRLPWWRLQPAPERVWQTPQPLTSTDRACCAVAPDACWVVYQPRGAARLTLKGLARRAWTARWFDPRTGAEHPAGPVELALDRSWHAGAPPTADDWVLIVTSDG